MRHMFVATFVLATVTSAAAQVQVRPTDPPLVTAVNESWYRLGEPLQFAGDLYYRGGVTVFFNGNTMVRTGHYNGIPLYIDTTVEPYSIVLVPIERGLMQPYERRRSGELAGTTGSRPPSFPVQTVSEAPAVVAAPSAPTGAPTVTGAVGVFTPAPAPAPAREVVGTAGVIVRPAAPTLPSLASVRRPESNDGVWIPFGGERWVSAGRAVPYVPSDFRVVGNHAGFPVYARRELQEDVIYVPTATGFIAPYRLKE